MDLHLDLLRGNPDIPVQIRRAAAARLEVRWPTFRRPFLIRASGLHIEVLQKQIPEVGEGLCLGGGCAP